MNRQPLRLAIIEAVSVLEEAGVPSPRADAELLAAHLLGIERTRLGLVPLVDVAMVEAYRAMIAQRAKRIPLQYITGTSAMGEIDLAVGPGVFVPRPETELLLGWALAFLEGYPRRSPVVLDLCTGSGALALAIAHARPDAVVHAVELEPKALAWARRNAEDLASQGDTPIVLHQGDVTDRDLLTELEGSVDVIVANPPYIPEGTELEPEVVDHDPHSALFGGPDGLSVIKPLVSNVARWLRIGGAVAVEHDDTNGDLTAALFSQRRVFGEVAEHPDLVGRPRFVVALRVPTDAEAQRARAAGAAGYDAAGPAGDDSGTHG
ncbi:MAG: peptide chain release factor N(5)-glutamine methyltransferase [Rhodococcus sp. (in: high G+C Gram-positive bacteria)]|uniref:peptide chain release factor N(5)-glutamine methyltransferase n=1 Tax=Rhodococcus sp. TaxID=1831 RepID=UPI003BB6866D